MCLKYYHRARGCLFVVSDVTVEGNDLNAPTVHALGSLAGE
jgi:hypothetical protein